jgi:hypothetical protein
MFIYRAFRAKALLSALKRTVSGGPDYLSRKRLLLPGAFLVAIGAQLFTPFMFINFTFAAFF